MASSSQEAHSCRFNFSNPAAAIMAALSVHNITNVAAESEEGR
jgi:hypothetical protein